MLDYISVFSLVPQQLDEPARSPHCIKTRFHCLVSKVKRSEFPSCSFLSVPLLPFALQLYILQLPVCPPPSQQMNHSSPRDWLLCTLLQTPLIGAVRVRRRESISRFKRSLVLTLQRLSVLHLPLSSPHPPLLTHTALAGLWATMSSRRCHSSVI